MQSAQNGPSAASLKKQKKTLTKELKVAEKNMKSLQHEREVLAKSSDDLHKKFSDVAYDTQKRQVLQEAQDEQDDIDAKKIEYEQLKEDRAAMMHLIEDGDAW